jgi:hypothetical protein
MATRALPASQVLSDDEDIAAAHSPKPSWLRRFYDAMIEAQQLRAMREIDRKLGSGAFARALRTPLPPEA